jgi:SAM-dependent methyltransferase
VGRELERRPAPAELDVRMVALRLGDQRHPRDESERVAEIGKGELASQHAVAVSLPLGNLRRQLGSVGLGEGRRARCADLTVGGGKLSHGSSVALAAGGDKLSGRDMSATLRFFDDERYLRTVVAEKAPGESEAQAHAAAGLAGCGPGEVILDAGCGNGRHALPLSRAGYRVVGLDGSGLLLAAARRAARGAPWPHFVRGSYARLPFAQGAFASVLCLGTALGYLGDDGDRAALREFRRVLAPGGRLVLETLHRAELGARLREHEERLLAGGGTLRFERRFDRSRGVMYETQFLEDGRGDGSPRAYELRVYSADELRRMLEDAGFAVIGRHGSLAGVGEPLPDTPLVLVGERRDGQWTPTAATSLRGRSRAGSSRATASAAAAVSAAPIRNAT